ncbi:LysR family transcriptional regulator [Vibrio cholerae]|nr:LysR family transcriptional regulator [Vibrio cholerae]
MNFDIQLDDGLQDLVDSNLDMVMDRLPVF